MTLVRLYVPVNHWTLLSLKFKKQIKNKLKKYPQSNKLIGQL